MNFIQIGNDYVNVAHIVRVKISGTSVRITCSDDVVYRLTGKDAAKFIEQAKAAIRMREE